MRLNCYVASRLSFLALGVAALLVGGSLGGGTSGINTPLDCASTPPVTNMGYAYYNQACCCGE